MTSSRDWFRAVNGRLGDKSRWDSCLKEGGFWNSPTGRGICTSRLLGEDIGQSHWIDPRK